MEVRLQVSALNDARPLKSVRFPFLSHLGDNPCGSYGLSLRQGEEDRDVCHAGELFSGDIGASSSDGSLTIALWFGRNADFDLKCFLWATHDGALPEEAGDPIDDDVLDELVRQLVHMVTPPVSFPAMQVGSSDLVKEQDLSPDGESTTLSTASIYHFVENDDDDEDCTDGICTHSVTLAYHRNRPCSRQTSCAGASNLPCHFPHVSTLYFLQRAGRQRLRRLWHPPQLRRRQQRHLRRAERVPPRPAVQGPAEQGRQSDGGALAPRDRPELRCTLLPLVQRRRSPLPGAEEDDDDDDEPLDPDDLLGLVNGTEAVQKDVLDVELQPMAPDTVLCRLPVQRGRRRMRGEEEDGVCQKRFRFAWLRDETCVASFVCGRLDGNVCGDYGVTFGVDGNDSASAAAEVCFERRVRRATMARGDVAAVSGVASPPSRVLLQMLRLVFGDRRDARGRRRGRAQRRGSGPRPQTG